MPICIRIWIWNGTTCVLHSGSVHHQRPCHMWVGKYQYFIIWSDTKNEISTFWLDNSETEFYVGYDTISHKIFYGILTGICARIQCPIDATHKCVSSSIVVCMKKKKFVCCFGNCILYVFCHSHIHCAQCAFNSTYVFGILSTIAIGY